MKYHAVNRSAVVVVLLIYTVAANGQIGENKGAFPTPTLTQQQLTAISRLEKIADNFSIAIDEDHFQDVPAHVKVAGSSILVLWDYQPESEKQRLRKLTRYLISTYIENFVEKKHSRVYLKRSVRYAIGEMAKKDKSEGQKLLKEFFEAEEGLLSKMDDDEKMELAEDLLEIDLSKSLSIAESVLLRSLPQRTIRYLSRLKELSPTSHNGLFGKIVSIISLGVIYSVRDELVIQSYIFKETFTAYPVVEKSDVPGLDKFEFPVGGVDYNEKDIFRNQPTTADEVRLYVSGSITGLRRKTPFMLNGFSSAQAFFLASKLLAYKDVHSESLQHLSGPISTLVQEFHALALSNRVSPENIEHLKFMALSVVLNRFGDSISDTANDGVDDNTDSATKIRVLETNILRAISKKEFGEAEKLIFEIKDFKTNQALTDFLNYSIISDLTQDGRKSIEVDERLSKISNLNVKVISLFEVAESAIKNNLIESGGHYLFLARQIISDRLVNQEKPQMLVGLLALQTKLDRKVNTQILSETVGTLTSKNTGRSEMSTDFNIYSLVYRGDTIRLYSRNVVDGGIQYTFPESSIEAGFKAVAGINWDDALSYAESIDSKFLQDRAVLSVCSMALPPKTANR